MRCTNGEKVPKSAFFERREPGMDFRSGRFASGRIVRLAAPGDGRCPLPVRPGSTVDGTFRASLRDLFHFAIDPAVNCRAIFKGSFGTKSRGGLRPQRKALIQRKF